MRKIAPYWKAVIGFVAPAAVLLPAAFTEASDGGSTLTTSELVTAICACVVTAAGVGLGPKNADRG